MNAKNILSLTVNTIACICTCAFSEPVKEPVDSNAIVIENASESNSTLNDTNAPYNHFKTNFSISSGIGSAYGGYGSGVSYNIFNRLGIDFDFGIKHFPNVSWSLRYVKSLDNFPLSLNPGLTIGYRDRLYCLFFGPENSPPSQIFASLNLKIKGYISKSVFLTNTVGFEYVYDTNNKNFFNSEMWDFNYWHASLGIGYTFGGSPGSRNYRTWQKGINVPIFIGLSLAGILVAEFTTILVHFD